MSSRLWRTDTPPHLLWLGDQLWQPAADGTWQPITADEAARQALLLVDHPGEAIRGQLSPALRRTEYPAWVDGLCRQHFGDSYWVSSILLPAPDQPPPGQILRLHGLPAMPVLAELITRVSPRGLLPLSLVAGYGLDCPCVLVIQLPQHLRVVLYDTTGLPAFIHTMPVATPPDVAAQRLLHDARSQRWLQPYIPGTPPLHVRTLACDAAQHPGLAFPSALRDWPARPLWWWHPQARPAWKAWAYGLSTAALVTACLQPGLHNFATTFSGFERFLYKEKAHQNLPLHDIHTADRSPAQPDTPDLPSLGEVLNPSAAVLTGLATWLNAHPEQRVYRLSWQDGQWQAHSCPRRLIPAGRPVSSETRSTQPPAAVNITSCPAARRIQEDGA